MVQNYYSKLLFFGSNTFFFFYFYYRFSVFSDFVQFWRIEISKNSDFSGYGFDLIPIFSSLDGGHCTFATFYIEILIKESNFWNFGHIEIKIKNFLLVPMSPNKKKIEN